MKTVEEDFYRKALVRVASEFGVVHPFQLIAISENNEENYVDLLIKQMRTVRAKEKLDAWKQGMSDALEIQKNTPPSEHWECSQAILTTRNNKTIL